jgi:hypothetical protein
VAQNGPYKLKYIHHGKPIRNEKITPTLNSVQTWINQFEGANGRLRFFSDG